jgi:Rad3-related DNA helicase
MMLQKLKKLLNFPSECLHVLRRIRSICTETNKAVFREADCLRDQADQSFSKTLSSLQDLHVLLRTDMSHLDNRLSGILKRLSSIEVEMLVCRRGSLDNNFEGKQDL